MTMIDRKGLMTQDEITEFMKKKLVEIAGPIWLHGAWWGCALGIVATGAGVLFVRWMGWAP